jgi:hypothetical protein
VLFIRDVVFEILLGVFVKERYLSLWAILRWSLRILGKFLLSSVTFAI